MIFLDLPAVVCLWGIAQRRRRYRGGQHHQDGVFDRITWSFVKYILSYRRTMRPKVLELTTTHAPNATLIVLRSRKAANDLVAKTAATA